MKKITFFYIMIMWIYPLFSQDEFVVNTFMQHAQRDPQISRDATGNYVVVWTSEFQINDNSEGDIYLQLLDVSDQKVGSEVLVNTVTEGDQEEPAVSMNTGGDFVVVWASRTNLQANYNIYGQLFRNNQASGSNFQINTTINHAQARPDVAMHADGHFLVVWDSWFQDGSDRGVFAQLFDPDGNKIGTEFLVNETTAYSQARPRVKYLDNGEFIVIWESWKQDIVTPSGYGLFGQRFSPEGNKIGGEFQINTYTNDYQWFGDIETFGDGSFVVTWCSWAQDGSAGGIYAQQYDTSGGKAGQEILVNSSTQFYQWLPSIAKLPDDNFVIVWGSWKQDGSNEGIFGKIFDNQGREKSLEMQINVTTDNFQWEPDVIGTAENEIIAVWSSWVSAENDYEVTARRTSLESPIGYINPSSISPSTGTSTTEIIVHVLDSLAVTGDIYQLTFQVPDSVPPTLDILNTNSSQTVVDDFPLNAGEGTFYLTPSFEGIAVEIIPVFELNLNAEKSYLINNTGTNLTFDIFPSGDSFENIAPLDAILVWGNSDTLQDGSYVAPLDTALSVAGQFEIQVPFLAWDVTNDQQLDLWVIEESSTRNNRWDVNESIRILTPDPYKTKLGDSHALMEPVVPAGDLFLPGIGDTLVVLTRRPITEQDTIRFQTSPQDIVSGIDNPVYQLPDQLELAQNYPNPFNPTTTIVYTLPQSGKASLTVFNVLGQKVMNLVDGYQQKGRHKVLFNSADLGSGIYFYTLKQGNQFISRKMILVK